MNLRNPLKRKKPRHKGRGDSSDFMVISDDDDDNDSLTPPLISHHHEVVNVSPTSGQRTFKSRLLELFKSPKKRTPDHSDPPDLEPLPSPLFSQHTPHIDNPDSDIDFLDFSGPNLEDMGHEPPVVLDNGQMAAPGPSKKKRLRTVGVSSMFNHNVNVTDPTLGSPIEGMGYPRSRE